MALLAARTGRKLPSCQRASVYTRSARRFRYGMTWLSTSQPSCAATTVSRSARRTTVRATSSAAATRFSPGSTNSCGAVEARRDVVDDGLEARHHLARHERHTGLELRPVRRRGRELGAHDEQLALEPDEQLVELRTLLGFGPRDAERGDRLVDGPVRRSARLRPCRRGHRRGARSTRRRRCACRPFVREASVPCRASLRRQGPGTPLR